MTDEKPEEPKAAPEKTTAPSQTEIANLLEKLPQQTRIEVVRELFMGVVKESGFPKFDPEVIKIISASVEKDNENKFQYLTQKQRDATEIKKREQDQEGVQHKDRIKLLWPILIAAILCGLGLISAGVWFVLVGKEAIGVGFITAVLSAAFGYLGGLGTARLFKPK